MWLLCSGDGWKYLTSMVGRMVFTLPPRTLPAKSVEMNRLWPPVGVIGWFTVLYEYDGSDVLVWIRSANSGRRRR